MEETLQAILQWLGQLEEDCPQVSGEHRFKK